ncbi:Bgt-2729 [Blumeria graminis f. sp. tritici]|uniref:Uncharacterized protein n=3 Tax=Blumeria graminis f. sp. tritici TaxID=62690 RepID=A0A656KJY4_BLUGR|nr:hypothetical protein BGT96224_2729 [Blumeria graminis f. sp. tritici 96224]VDB93966.1 Bgt-2729 [Blumeria graminis f. sp. tritici]
MAFDSSDDNISLTSTVISIHSENEFFEVERILAENIDSSTKTFLIQWEGYPISRATWEPRKQIQHLRPVMVEWRERQAAEANGDQKPFDTAAWEAARRDSENEKQKRKYRRRSKRKRQTRAVRSDQGRDMRSRSTSIKKKESKGSSSDEAIENFRIKNDPGEKLIQDKESDVSSEPRNPLNRRAPRVKRWISSSDDEVASLTAPSAASCPRIAEDVNKSIDQTKNNLDTISPFLLLPDSPKRKKIFPPRKRLSSSSSDEPLSQVLRRSKFPQVKNLAYGATLNNTIKPHQKVSDPSGDSNFSKVSSLAKKSLGSREVESVNASNNPSTAQSEGSKEKNFKSQAVSLPQKTHNSSCKSPNKSNENIVHRDEKSVRNSGNLSCNTEAKIGLNESSNSQLETGQQLTLPKIPSRDTIQKKTLVNLPGSNEFLHKPVIEGSITKTQNTSSNAPNNIVKPFQSKHQDSQTRKSSSTAPNLHHEQNPRSKKNSIKQSLTVIPCLSQKAPKDSSHSEIIKYNSKNSSSIGPGALAEATKISQSPQILPLKSKSPVTPNDIISKEILGPIARLQTLGTAVDTTCPKAKDSQYLVTDQNHATTSNDADNQNSKVLQAQNTSHINNQSKKLHEDSGKPKRQQDSQETSYRPAWDPNNPFKSICYFWNRDKVCARISTCRFSHSIDPHLPIAPCPKAQKRIRKALTNPASKFRLTKNCPQPLTCKSENDILSNETLRPKEKAEDGINSRLNTSALADKEALTQSEDKLHQDSPDIIQKNKNSSLECKDSQETSHNSLRRTVRFKDPSDKQIFTNTESFDFEKGTKIREDDKVVPQILKDKGITLLELGNLHSMAINDNPLIENVLNLKSASTDVAKSNQISFPSPNSNKGVKDVVLGADDITVTFDFGEYCAISPHTWKEAFGTVDKLYFKQSCIAQDFQSQSELNKLPVLWQDGIKAVDPNDTETKKITQDIYDELVLGYTGLIARFGEYFVLVYPAKRGEWGFLDESQYSNFDFRLCYSIFAFNGYEVPQSSTPIGTGAIPYAQHLFFMAQNILIKDLFLYPLENCGPSTRSIYLLFPPSASQLADTIKTCLLSHNPATKIYGSMTQGSWDMFCQSQLSKKGDGLCINKDSAIVLAHESIVTGLCRVPNLFAMLNNTDAIFWQISENVSAYPPYPSHYPNRDVRLGNINSIRLFPSGCAVFLTPSFLIAEPKAALNFIRWFSHEKDLDVSTPWKLAGAYGLSDYVLEVASSKASEASCYEERHLNDPRKKSNMEERCLDYETCDARWSLYSEIVKLSPSTPDYSNFEDELEDCLVQAPFSIHPDNEHELIRWFAAWSSINADVLRKFIIIGTNKSNAFKARYIKKIQSKNTEGKVTPESYIPERYRESTFASDRTYTQMSSPGLWLRPPTQAQIFEPQRTGTSVGFSEKMPGNSDKVIRREITRPTQAQEKERSCDGNELLASLSVDPSVNSGPLTQIKEENLAFQEAKDYVNEQRFESTIEWYKRVQTRGRSWEHLAVLDHTEAWKLLGG